MEQDLERSEEKVELSERFVLCANANSFFPIVMFCYCDLFSNHLMSMVLGSLIIIFTYIYSKIVELEEELRVVGNNLKSLEVSEEKVRYCWIKFCFFFQ